MTQVANPAAVMGNLGNVRVTAEQRDYTLTREGEICWVAMHDPDYPVSSEMSRWNSTCLKCHTTHPRERRRESPAWDTQVAEFGIGCEACHGPGQEHVALRRQLINDPYDAVRLIARRSMRSLPGFQNLEYDAIGPEAKRRRVITRVMATWRDHEKPGRESEPQILIDASGLQNEQLQRLLQQRDNTPVQLNE